MPEASSAASEPVPAQEPAAAVVPPSGPPPAHPPAPANQPPKGGGVPVPALLAAAIIPAIIVGLLVFFVAGGSDSSNDGDCAGVLDGFVRISLDQSDGVEASCDLPDGFPDDFPVYSGAKLDGAFAIKSSDGTTFIVAYTTDAEKDKVYDYYLDKMDEDPWQIELSRQADDFTGMQFSRPDSADIQGSIQIEHSDLDNRTSIFVFVLDGSLTGSADSGNKQIPTASHDLPPGFPSDIPIFKGKADSIVTSTFFQRDAGQNGYIISFLTKDADVDVINFYTEEFKKRGWVVKDGASTPGDFALTLDYDDGKPTKEVQGSVRADVYADDASYTEVNLLVQVSARRGRGN